MRRKLMEVDLIECVLGLGPNLFHNLPMDACVVICRSGPGILPRSQAGRLCHSKLPERRGKILFSNAVNEASRERAQSFLTDAHIERIVGAFRNPADEAAE